jgi:fumarate hydratase subunit beta
MDIAGVCGVSGKRLNLPLSKQDIEGLCAGEMVLLNGPLYTARDAAHKRLIEMLERGEQPPFELEGQAVYYVGPCPARPGQIIGSAGPTTSGRMDKYSPKLMQQGLRVMIGKGERSEAVRQCIKDCGGAYVVAIGGAGAYLARCVCELEGVAFEDLGTEAIRRITVQDFPVIVSIDSKGNTARS